MLSSRIDPGGYTGTISSYMVHDAKMIGSRTWS